MRVRVLLFALVSVGLVALMGSALFVLASRGVRSMERIFSMQEQSALYGKLLGDAVWVPHLLVEAREQQRDLRLVLEPQLQRAEADFERMRQLVPQVSRPGQLAEELARVEQVRRAYLEWLGETEARVHRTPVLEEGRLGAGVLDGALDSFDEKVMPLLQVAWKQLGDRLEEHRKARLEVLRFNRRLGVAVPLVALALVLLLAGSIFVTLHRASRELLRGAARIGQGDFSHELPVGGPDEYAMLARAFNRMTVELRDTVREKERLAKAEAEASERETRRANARLEETVRQRTAALEEANAQLLFADRLATMGQLAASVGHEINNPLAFILSNLNFARDELKRTEAPSPVEREELLEALAEAHEGAERVRLLVQDLRMLAHPDEAVTGPVDVGSLLRSASKMAAHEIRHRARLELVSDNVPPVHGNGARLCQVFLNLLINAAHAIAPGQVERNEIKLLARKHTDSHVLVEVSDTGSGIPPEHLERIFEAFFTTKPTGVGTGLGLSVCHRIVTAHGGEISVQSEQGRGTTFRVTLPIHHEGQSPG